MPVSPAAGLFPRIHRIKKAAGFLRLPYIIPYFYGHFKLIMLFSLQSLQQLFSLCLIARLSEQSKHILLVALNARLVEGINTE